jgi:hypothetical protein
MNDPRNALKAFSSCVALAALCPGFSSAGWRMVLCGEALYISFCAWVDIIVWKDQMKLSQKRKTLLLGRKGISVGSRFSSVLYRYTWRRRIDSSALFSPCSSHIPHAFKWNFVIVLGMCLLHVTASKLNVSK